MLAGLRVLEISGPETMLAGSILADLGADVVVVEPPGGAPGRRLEPFVEDRPGLERSLTWQALNRNKRGITLDFATRDGLDILGSLAGRFDVLLERTPTGNAASVGEQLKLPAEAIHCVVRPFHPGGEKAGYVATDLVLMAASGSLGMMGDADRPPVPLPVPQAKMEAGAEAAIAVLAAVVARGKDGAGQEARVSARLAAMVSSFGSAMVSSSGNPEAARSGGGARIAGVHLPSIFPCADGFVVASLAFGSAWGPMTNRLAAWAQEQGHLSEDLATRDWSPFVAQLQAGEVTGDDLQGLVDGVSALFAKETKERIWEQARTRGLLAAPAMDMGDIASSPQFSERGLWNDVSWHDREFKIPVRWAQFSNHSIETVRLAPTLSEHTTDILSKELGLSPDEIQALFVHGIT